MENEKSSTVNQSGNMYTYQEPQNVQIGVSEAIRRSVGKGNPNALVGNPMDRLKTTKTERIAHQNSIIIQIDQKPPLYWMFFLIFGIIQIIFIILIGSYYTWNKYNSPKNLTDDDEAFEQVNNNYKLFQDINIVILFGFGLLRSFLQHYSWTSISLTFLAGLLSFEFGLFMLICWSGIFRKDWYNGEFNFEHIFDANYCAATIIISLGSVLGKMSFPQYFIMIIVETFFSTLNYVLLRQSLKIIDVGGTLTIHLFGALFGGIFSLISLVRTDEKERLKNNSHYGYNYNSNIFALFGTLILIAYWPSFNVALIKKDEEEQKFNGIVNTFLSILGSIVGAFITSPLCNQGYFRIKDIINSSFSGAIVIAGCCHLKQPYSASIILGNLSGALTTYLCNVISNRLRRKGFHDTSDVIYYHGIPGLLGGIITTIFVGVLFSPNKEIQKNELYKYVGTLLDYSFDAEGKINISYYALIHFAGILITIAISISSGFVAGFAIKFCNCKITLQYFNDSEFFDVKDSEPFPWDDDQVELKIGNYS